MLDDRGKLIPVSVGGQTNAVGTFIEITLVRLINWQASRIRRGTIALIRTWAVSVGDQPLFASFYLSRK